jgi:hypothetical protein
VAAGRVPEASFCSGVETKKGQSMKTRWPLFNVSGISFARGNRWTATKLSAGFIQPAERGPAHLSAEMRSVCHLPILPADSSGEPDARSLRKSLVERNEDYVRRVIAGGTEPRMPGMEVHVASGSDRCPSEEHGANQAMALHPPPKPAAW